MENEMQNDPTLLGNEITGEQYNPLTTITSKPGYLTSQFGLTATFTIVCMVLGYFGISQTPEQIEGYLGIVERIATTLVPIIGGIWAVINYTNSRGKIASNTVNANSAVQVAALSGLGGLSAILGGKNWKDPARYINIADIVGKFVPQVGGVMNVIKGDPPKDTPPIGGDSDVGMITVEEMKDIKELLKLLRERK